LWSWAELAIRLLGLWRVRWSMCLHLSPCPPFSPSSHQRICQALWQTRFRAPRLEGACKKGKNISFSRLQVCGTFQPSCCNNTTRREYRTAFIIRKTSLTFCAILPCIGYLIYTLYWLHLVRFLYSNTYLRQCKLSTLLLHFFLLTQSLSHLRQVVSLSDRRDC
jgi:hypothetical protein